MTGEKAGAGKAAEWAGRIAAQQRSGVSVKFYSWRRRLQNKEPVRFALVEAGAQRQKPGSEPAVEVILANGERLRIVVGVDATTLRTVLEALRG